MFKVSGFEEMKRRTKGYRLQQECAKADFRCDSCGAPVYIDYGRYTNIFGDVFDSIIKTHCRYCCTEYEVNAYEFDLYRRKGKPNQRKGGIIKF